MSDPARKPEPEKAKPAPRGKPGRRAPALLELAYSLSVIVIGVAGLTVAGLSLLAGVEVWMAVVRAGLLVLALGALGWFLNYRLMHGALAAAVAEAREKQAAAKASEPESASLGLEWKA